MNNSVTYLDIDGMRAIHVRVPGAAVGYAGIVIGAGTRDEDLDAGEEGLAHFVEHTIFKGTARRSSWHIINRMEAVGGELNAFTSKEDTVVYTVFPRANAERAIELVTDLVANSSFPDSELDKEREVVADEIDSYLDTPSEAVYDEFEDIIFRGTPLGHNILGTRKSLAAFDSKMCRRWVDRLYTRDRMVCFYAGPESADTFARRLAKHVTDIPVAASAYKPTPITLGDTAFGDREKAIDTHQAHTVLGSVITITNRHERMNLSLLSNILGGPGMNSLLNVTLRERRGLVYTVESSVTPYIGLGEFNVYFGCDPEDSAKCLSLVKQQLDDIAQSPLTPHRLAAAKKQYRGQLLIGRENRESQILSAARATLLRGTAMTRAEVSEAIDAITPDTLLDMARRIASPSSLTFTAK